MIGGGVSEGLLYNCTLVGNSAAGGGGAAWSTLRNCIVYDNSAPDGPNHSECAVAFTCTTPLAEGLGNIDMAPAFVSPAAGNFRLSSGSPCINAGHTSYVTTPTDLDGRPRIVGGSVDMGAYEFQGTGSVISYAWLQQFGLPTDGSADFTDPDGDLLNTFQEWTADTDPTDGASVLRIVSITPGPPVSVSLQSSTARLYTLQSRADLSTGGWTPVPGATDIPGTGGLLSFTDPNPGSSRFYRISVRRP
jgi:hypothetical protein